MSVEQISREEFQQEFESQRQSHFDKLHSQELVNIGKNFTSDEQVDICKVVSSKIMKEELDRRKQRIDEILTALVSKAKEYTDDLDLIGKEELLAEIRQIVRVQ